jgi:uncharacterized repeat protein (TIGR01451 family)
MCSGSAASCPNDVFADTGTLCRESGGVCDPAEVCTGTTASCPANKLEPSSTVCRPSIGVCDVAESCTGNATNCPSDKFAANSVVCRAAEGICDVPEKCSGAEGVCPGDALAPVTAICKAASVTPACVANTCSGTDKTCSDECIDPATLCGNGKVDSGEQCDGGGCCTSSCKFISEGTQCRASKGTCDIAEFCPGDSGACPADELASSTAVCRSAKGVCDAAEYCSGSSVDCPDDALAPSTQTCRPSVGSCDMAETCSGDSIECPSDKLAAATTVCRESAGSCDVAETCSGDTPVCPDDAYQPATAVCRPSAGICDVDELCSGSSAACPNDVLVSAGTACRAAEGVCDAVEVCSGSAAACPTDRFLSAGTSCRASAGVCDVAEVCTGNSVACPIDTKVAAGTTCRASAGTCDVAEQCTGSDDACPSDLFAPASQVCRAGTVSCKPNTCTETSASCPTACVPVDSLCGNGTVDSGEQCDGGTCCTNECTFKSTGTTCRVSAGACDIAEACSGTSAACPADVLKPASTVCRESTGACDAAESCTGNDPACPSNGVDSGSNVCDLPKFVVAISDARETAAINDMLTYTVTVQNTSDVPANAVAVSAQVPADVLSDVAPGPGGTLVSVVNQVQWKNVSISAHSQKQFTFLARVRMNAAPGAVVTTVAQAGGETGQDTTKITAIVPAMGCIQITKTVQGRITSPEQPLPAFNFGITAANGQATTAVSDGLGAARVNGLAPGLYTVNEVPSSGWQTIGEASQVVAVKAGLDCARAAFENTPVKNAATFTISKSDNKTTTFGGQVLDYEIVIRNTGMTSAKNLKVTDVLPAALTFVSATMDGVYAGGARTVTWVIPSLASSETAILRVKAKVNIGLADGFAIQNVASVLNGPSATDVTVVKQPIADVGAISISTRGVDWRGNFTLVPPAASYILDGNLDTAYPSNIFGLTFMKNVPVGTHTLTEILPPTSNWLLFYVIPGTTIEVKKNQVTYVTVVNKQNLIVPTPSSSSSVVESFSSYSSTLWNFFSSRSSSSESSMSVSSWSSSLSSLMSMSTSSSSVSSSSSSANTFQFLKCDRRARYNPGRTCEVSNRSIESAIAPNYTDFMTITFDTSETGKELCDEKCKNLEAYVSCCDRASRECAFVPRTECLNSQKKQNVAFPIQIDGSSACPVECPRLP